MKIIGISGSPRNKNTNYMLKTLLKAAGQEYELFLLQDMNIEYCNACGGCYKSHKCIIEDDMQGLYKELMNADIIVLGSPTYFDNVTALMKTFIDRCLPLYLAERLKNKKVALVSVGGLQEGEADFADDYSPNEAMKDPVQREEMEDSVKGCLNNIRSFSKAMNLEIVGSVFAINGDPSAVKNDLIRLGERLRKE